MPTLTPVDFDPFASGGPKLTPVDHDPFDTGLHGTDRAINDLKAPVAGVASAPGDIQSMLMGAGSWVRKKALDAGIISKETYDGLEKRVQASNEKYAIPGSEEVNAKLGYNPQGSTEGRILNAAGNTAAGSMLLPGGGLKALVAGALGGGEGQAVTEATGSPLAGAAASVVAPWATARLANGVKNSLGARANPLPDYTQLKQSGAAANDAFRQSGVSVPAGDINNFVGGERQNLENRGLFDFVAPGAHKMLDKMEADAAAGLPISAPQLSAYRQTLRKIGEETQDFRPTQNAAAGQTLRGTFDNMLNANPRIAPEMAALNEGNQNYAGAIRQEAIQTMLDKADALAAGQHSGLNFTNTARQQARSLVFGKNAPTWTAGEKTALDQLIEGSRTANTLRTVSNFMGGGGGLGTHMVAHNTARIGAGLAGGAAGESEGGHLGGALGFLAGAAAGPGIRKLANLSTRRQIQALSDMTVRRTPMGRQAYNPTPYGGPSLAGMGPAMRALLSYNNGQQATP